MRFNYLARALAWLRGRDMAGEIGLHLENSVGKIVSWTVLVGKFFKLEKNHSKLKKPKSVGM